MLTNYPEPSKKLSGYIDYRICLYDIVKIITITINSVKSKLAVLKEASRLNDFKNYQHKTVTYIAVVIC